MSQEVVLSRFGDVVNPSFSWLIMCVFGRRLVLTKAMTICEALLRSPDMMASGNSRPKCGTTRLKNQTSKMEKLVLRLAVRSS